MTGKTVSMLCLAVLFAGCSDGDSASHRDAEARAAVAREADTARNALVADRRAVVEELREGTADPARRAELEAEEKRLSDEIRNANKERLRRDREEVRRQISEQGRGGK